jgi:hypothetical protein
MRAEIWNSKWNGLLTITLYPACCSLLAFMIVASLSIQHSVAPSYPVMALSHQLTSEERFHLSSKTG